MKSTSTCEYSPRKDRYKLILRKAQSTMGLIFLLPIQNSFSSFLVWILYHKFLYLIFISKTQASSQWSVKGKSSIISKTDSVTECRLLLEWLFTNNKISLTRSTWHIYCITNWKASRILQFSLTDWKIQLSLAPELLFTVFQMILIPFISYFGAFFLIPAFLMTLSKGILPVKI